VLDPETSYQEFQEKGVVILAIPDQDTCNVKPFVE
jgi:hypothetical protein